MFSDDEKLRYFDRLTVAKDIVCNIKDEMKQLAKQCEANGDEPGMLKAAFVGAKCCNTALEINSLQESILKVEKQLAEYMKKTEK